MLNARAYYSSYSSRVRARARGHSSAHLRSRRDKIDFYRHSSITSSAPSRFAACKHGARLGISRYYLHGLLLYRCCIILYKIEGEYYQKSYFKIRKMIKWSVIVKMYNIDEVEIFNKLRLLIIDFNIYV